MTNSVPEIQNFDLIEEATRVNLECPPADYILPSVRPGYIVLGPMTEQMQRFHLVRHELKKYVAKLKANVYLLSSFREKLIRLYKKNPKGNRGYIMRVDQLQKEIGTTESRINFITQQMSFLIEAGFSNLPCYEGNFMFCRGNTVAWRSGKVSICKVPDEFRDIFFVDPVVAKNARPLAC